MKKILILLIILLLPVGCINIHEANVADIIVNVQKSPLKLANQIRSGYKYYLPLDLSVNRVVGFNEVITSKDYTYFLYVDMVSYYNEIEHDYEINDKAYISLNITHNGLPGYLEVNIINDKYLIEIMYNYAKIELIVDEKYLNEAITNAIIILATIEYNDEIIANMMGDDILAFSEENFNIFETRSESNFLEYDEEHGVYEGVDRLPDLDEVRGER